MHGQCHARRPLMTSLPKPSLLVRRNELAALHRGNGISSLPFVGKWNSSIAKLTTGITQIPAGTGIPLHTHNVEETILVLAGTAMVTVADVEIAVAAGDATWVPAQVPHCFTNSGTEVLQIYWAYAGLNVTRTNCVTGETSDHLGGPADLDGPDASSDPRR